MTISDALRRATSALKELPRPLLEAELLLSSFLGKDRVFLHLHSDDDIVGDGFFDLLSRRKSGEPMEYITNSASFFSEDFFVQEGVLIPRPETELLVELAIKIINKKKYNTVCEVGVGSGAISIMLAKQCNKVNITALDISKDALAVAKKNIVNKKVENQIELIISDILSNTTKKFDLIVSNPPYISDSYDLPLGVGFEPSIALFGGEVGDELIKRLVLESKGRCKELLCEIGYDQRESLSRFFRENEIKRFRFFKDFSGFDRIFWIRF